MLRILRLIKTEFSEYFGFYILGIVFALLSGIRLPFLPEIELISLILYTFYQKNINYRVLLLLTIILCTHHYAIPDFIYRDDGSNYPSIYTRAYGGIKLLDILIIFLFMTSIYYFYRRNILKIIYIKGIPAILTVSSFIGLAFISKQQFSSDQFFFIARSYLLLLSIFILSLNFSKFQYENLCLLAIFCWTLKMIVSIIFPHNNPLYRPILGFNGIIYFAGDEYLDIPLYLAILILCRNPKISYRNIYSIVVLVFILTMIAQRKGAVTVLGSFLAYTYAYQHRNLILNSILKVYMIFASFIIFLFLYNIENIIDDPLILLAFDEYSNFAKISIDSLQYLLKTNPLGFIFGISPFGKYEIIGLPQYMDHMTSFGAEVGETYRYQFWSFPLGRCILNVGLIGFIYVFIMMALGTRYNIIKLYLIMAAIPICYYNNLTPVHAFAMGIVFSYLYYSNNQRKITQ